MQGHPTVLTPFMRVAVLVIASSLLAGCFQAQSEPTVDAVKPVKLYQIPMQKAHASDAFPARAEASQRAQLSFQVPGEIATLTVRVGQHVEAGQVLAQLDDTDYRLAFEAKLAEFELAKSQFQRAKQLFSKKLISTDEFDRHDTRYKAALANLEQARTDLEHTLLHAPFAGTVSLKHVNPHQFVGANQPIVNVQNVTTLDLSFSLPVSYVEQTDLATLQAAMIWVVMDNYAAQSLPAEFKELSTRPDADTNSYTAKVTVARPADRNMLSGMSAQVHIGKPSAMAALHLPAGSWVEKDDQQGTVWQVDPATGVVSALSLTLNARGDVVGGLQQGMVIVTAGAQELLSGQQVRAWEREGGI
ncbi:efflux RND transporter periplasmic adaptor subunit [Photobacterium japonica]|uniref:efflux RND transporter periplasmic adaptor subunit n=1 Tax=Photobacterium japonica TaxID=2910235 RepID=UPI003D0FB994